MSPSRITYCQTTWPIISAISLYKKIDGINESLDALQSDYAIAEGGCVCAVNECSCAVQSESPVCATLSKLKLLSQEQVAKLGRRAAVKSCPLHPMPTSEVLQVFDVLLLVLTSMINLPFESGQFAENWREALIPPKFKRCCLDIAYRNFRPVSNLPYVFKLSERAAADQLMDHMTVNDLHSVLQLPYKKHHSTESALLKVKNDILMNMDVQKVTLLVLLDLLTLCGMTFCLKGLDWSSVWAEMHLTGLHLTCLIERNVWELHQWWIIGHLSTQTRRPTGLLSRPAFLYGLH